MIKMKIAVLTSKKSWFLSYAQKLVRKLINNKYNSTLFFNHKKIDESFSVVFILSYFKIIEEKYLKIHKHNLVVHESDLPNGKGWAPLFWQILEGKNEIPIVLFEANIEADSGDIYLKDKIVLTGYELNTEIRKKQAGKTLELCVKFLDEYENLKSIKQAGEATFYPKRSPKDSELDINKPIKEQFNLLRIVNNNDFPAFFYIDNEKYVIKIIREESET